MGIYSEIIGCGSYLPSKVITNEELASMVDTSDEWITSRSGIKRRHFAAEDEFTSDLAIEAANRAVRNAGIDSKDIDIIIVGTTTPDDTFPATAVRVQRALGISTGAAFDIQAACSGFIFALSIADSMIKSGQASTALVIGADTLSKLLDWEDRSTCVLFGDGAGAVVLKGCENSGNSMVSSILSSHLHTDGNLRDILYCDNNLGSSEQRRKIVMEGKEVFRHAVNNLAAVVKEALEANQLEASQIDWLVPHQANKRIIDSTARKLGMGTDRIVLTISEHANTSAASIPLALDSAIRDGRIKKGHLLLMEAMGGGLTWGAALVRW